MTTGSTGTKRRALLQRGLALLAGGAAMAGGTRWARAASPPPPAPLTTLTLYTRQRPFVGAPGAAGHSHAQDGRLVASGELFDAPGGTRIGTFYSNCFCLHSSFGPQTGAASNLEFHVLELHDGTLFSIGSGGGAATERPLAIVGGTNRYAGRSGSYIERALPGDGPGDDVRELVITFAV